MQKRQSYLSSADPPGEAILRQQIVDYWIGLNMGGDAGATTWEVLDRLSEMVTESLMSQPPNLKRALALTAKASLLISAIDC